MNMEDQSKSDAFWNTVGGSPAGTTDGSNDPALVEPNPATTASGGDQQAFVRNPGGDENDAVRTPSPPFSPVDTSTLRPEDEPHYAIETIFDSMNNQGLASATYAMAHNRIPILRSLKIRGIGQVASARRLTIRFSSEWSVSDRNPFKEREVVLDAPLPGQSVELSPVDDLQLNDIALAELEEAAPAQLTIEVTDDLGRRMSEHWDVEVQARDQWRMVRWWDGEDPRMWVLTAAFCQPNHPDIQRVLKRAAQILQRQGRPGLSGYQGADYQQHHYIAVAVYEAMQEFVTTYINPPASFSELGQKLRPIDRVLEEQQGTCLDLACAYASCLEQAGLHPLIFVVRGHAFSGYIATPDGHLPQSVVHSWPAIQSLLDSKIIVPVETVGIPNGVDFARAHELTLARFDEDSMLAAIDIHLAHTEGVKPLPARIVRDNVVTVVVDNGPSAPPIIERRDAATRKLLPESVPERIQAWKNSLLDLSFRNRLLNLDLNRHGVNLLAPLGKLGYIEDALNNGNVLFLKAADNLDGIQAARQRSLSQQNQEALVELLERTNLLIAAKEGSSFTTAVRRLASAARSIEEDTGTNCLYLTLGSVKWSSLYGDYSSPLFLVPVRISNLRGASAAQIAMDTADATSVNHCLIEALRAREQLSLQWFADDMSDDLGLDVEAGLEAMRTELREAGLDLGGFSVDQSVGLAVLDFKKFRLWRDLNDHWKEFVKSPFVGHMVETPRETFHDPMRSKTGPNLTASSVVTIKSADGSQIEAIERALNGESFVLQGPPGSGKSQTITNLLANAMMRGKRILFVAEKQAALHEVAERLRAVGLWPYCLELHDSKKQPDDLRVQLRDALDQRPSLDERSHQQFEEEFQAIAGLLDDYRDKVYEPNPAGLSFASAYFRLRELGDGPTIDLPRSCLHLEVEAMESLRRSTLDIEEAVRIARTTSENIWSLAGAASFDEIDREELLRLATSCLDHARSLSAGTGEIFDVVRQATSADFLHSLSEVLEFRDRYPLLGRAALIKASDEKWLASVRSSLKKITKSAGLLPVGLRESRDLVQSVDIDGIAANVSEAASAFVIGRKKKIQQALGPLGKIIAPTDGDLDKAPTAVEECRSALKEVRTTWAKLADDEVMIAIGAELPVTESAQADLLDRASRVHRLATALAASSADATTLMSVWADASQLPLTFSRQISTFANDFAALCGILRVTETSLSDWCDGNGVVGAFVARGGDRWGGNDHTQSMLALQRWLALEQLLERFESAGLSEMCRDIERGVISGSDVPRAFERGLLSTTLKVRAEATDLDVFDGSLQNRRVAKFISMISERQSAAEEVIPYFLFKSRKINAGVSTGKIGEFRREVNAPSKRRRGRSIRSLIERYPEIVTDLTPCFLMSPASVALFVPPGSIEFDIVVFDEASQIVTAEAIGAMGRAKSCVIVGDSKQMPPTRVAVASDSDEIFSDNEVVDFEEESILEEAIAGGIPEMLLRWHYRSQDERLINFSNQHYYEGRLSTFPAPSETRTDCGIFYRRVDGLYDRGKTRTNKIEATAIMEELIGRLDDPTTAGLTYGIVTLNMEQRKLLEAMVDASDHPGVAALRDSDDQARRLFVLNLESVQGRERDVILLGTSFSRPADGRPMPLNFGPLTNVGGEKRLNVAVTRARRQMVVVSSFDPEDLARASSIGMIHLRNFLTAARDGEPMNDDRSESQSHAGAFVNEVAERLREHGVLVSVGHGLSDFRIDLVLTVPEHPDEWLVAVLFDSEGWSRRPLAVDRDALPAIVLTQLMGWQRVTRVWMPSLRVAFDDVIEELLAEVAGAARDHDAAASAMPAAKIVRSSDDRPAALHSADQHAPVEEPRAEPQKDRVPVVEQGALQAVVEQTPPQTVVEQPVQVAVPPPLRPAEPSSQFNDPQPASEGETLITGDVREDSELSSLFERFDAFCDKLADYAEAEKPEREEETDKQEAQSFAASLDDGELIDFVDVLGYVLGDAPGLSQLSEDDQAVLVEVRDEFEDESRDDFAMLKEAMTREIERRGKGSQQGEREATIPPTAPSPSRTPVPPTIPARPASKVSARESHEYSLPNEVPFRIVDFEGVPNRPDLLSTSAARTVLEHLVDNLGPIEVEDALKRLAREFGLSRVTASRLAELKGHLGTRTQTEMLGRRFLWPADTSESEWRSVRRTTVEQRKVTEVPPYEVINAMEALAHQSLSIQREELIEWIGTYFGSKRLTAGLRDFLLDCVDEAIRAGRLFVNGDELVAGPDVRFDPAPGESEVMADSDSVVDRGAGAPAGSVPNQLCFISHSSKDRSLITDLSNAIEERGAKTWLSFRDVKAGTDYAESIVMAIENCAVFVMVLSPRSTASGHCMRELDMAIELNRTIIPVWLEQHELPRGFTYRLRTIQITDIRDAPEIISGAVRR